ncbi:hypothetical protein Hanom_Chr11g01021821 [Helianthus anomalus]
MEAVWFFGLVASVRSRWLFLFQRWFMACSLYAQTPKQKAPLSPLVYIVYRSLVYFCCCLPHCLKSQHMWIDVCNWRRFLYQLSQLGLFGEQEVGELSVWAPNGFIVWALVNEDVKMSTVFAIEGEDDFPHVRRDDFLLTNVLDGALKARKNDIPVKSLLTICQGREGMELSDGDCCFFLK